MEVEQANTSEQNISMEELKMEEDENVKEISMEEDILGAQSLLMSESEEEGNDEDNINKKNKSPQKKIASKKTKRILDSDDEEDEKNKSTELEDKEVEESVTNIQKISALIDSDSDQVEEESSNDKENKQNKKVSNIIDSDEETEIDTKANFKQIKQGLKKTSKEDKKSKQKAHKKKKEHKNSGEEENADTDNSDSEAKTNKSKKKAKKSKTLSNSDSEVETRKESKKISSLVDSDSSDSESQTDLNESDLEASARQANIEENNNNEDNSKEKKPKVIRASAKKALDEMQAIQSEQQRLHREAHISIPYHKPKKHTLDEFLKRRTIIQPQTSSPVAAAVQSRRLKMTAEELEEYAKLMEERAKEATEFFKSESESEDEEVFKDNEGVLDKTAAPAEESNQQNQENTNKETTLAQTNDIEMQQNVETDELKENLDGVQLTEEELAELLAEQEQALPGNNVEEAPERPSCSKVLITEVIELPKLDMNTVRISPVKKHTPRPSLNIKQLLAEKNLSGSPSLSGDPNKLIDLETGNLIEKKSSGIENLMKRLMSTVKAKKSKTSEACNILSVENGKLEISKVNISITETKDVQKEPKPGAAYFELKKNLKEIIKKKRLEEMNKKQEDELEYSKCLADDDDDDEEEVEEDNENDNMEVEEYEPENKPKNKVVLVDEDENALVVEDDENEDPEEENVVEINSDDDEEAENKNQNNDDEEEDNDDDEDDEEDEDDNDENTETVEKTQRKNRIIKAFDDSDEEEGANDDIDFLKTQPPTTQPPLFDTQASAKTSLVDEENELMALCSGTFDATQKTSVNNALMSQIPITQNSGKPVNDEELMELCSGTFDQPTTQTQQPTQTPTITENLKTKCNKIISSDEENDEDQLDKNEENKQRVKKLTKKLKKKKAKLGFSDDEEEDDEKEEDNDVDDEEDVEEQDDDVVEVEAEEPETFVDYDSEENEVIVQMTKKDKVKQAQNFFEKEAELSESEWGSADEDEKNLDKYDIELGDEDEFDREKLQTELGQIHARKMLDEDLREVRKIQEMLFEDEEKDGVGRQRTFKWKNAESGFSLDDGRPLDDDGQNGDSGDEINEHQWRKIRYEREQFLKEQGLKPDSQDMSTVLPNTTIPSLNSSTSSMPTTKKLQIITAKKTSVSSDSKKASSPFLISKGISSMHKKSVRGSFLVRDKEILNKLAGLTKGASASAVTASDMDNTAGTVSIKSIKPKNFVFATLTEEEHENLKRKADDLLNSSNENGKNFMKKPRIEPRRDKCFIDQLL